MSDEGLVCTCAYTSPGHALCARKWGLGRGSASSAPRSPCELLCLCVALVGHVSLSSCMPVPRARHMSTLSLMFRSGHVQVGHLRGGEHFLGIVSGLSKGWRLVIRISGVSKPKSE